MHNFFLVLASVGGLALPTACSSAGTPEGDAAPVPMSVRQAGPFLYVANQEAATVSIIDLASNEVTETIDLQQLGFAANAKPHHTAVEPDGSFWYVSLIAAGKVLKFDRSNRLVGSADFETPGMLALHPTQDLLYVGRSMAAVNPPQRIGVLQRSTMEMDEVDVFFGRPHAIAVDPRGDWVYSGSLASNQIASINIESGELELTNLSGTTHVLVQFALSPDGRWMVATGQLTGKLLVFDSSDPAHLRLSKEIDVNGSPWHPTFTPDGRTVWFGNQATNTVTVVDARTWTVVDVIEGEGLAEPHGIAVSPNGRTVYVSNRNVKGDYAPGRGMSPTPNRGDVVAIDVATRTITKVIPVGVYAAGISTVLLN